MKVGDKLYCKKDLQFDKINLYYDGSDVFHDFDDYDFVSGNFYEIIEIDYYENHTYYIFGHLLKLDKINKRL